MNRIAFSAWSDVIDGGGAAEVGINGPQNCAIDEVKNECGGRCRPPNPQAEKPVSRKRHEDDHHGKPREHAEDEPLDDRRSRQAFPEPGIQEAPDNRASKEVDLPRFRGEVRYWVSVTDVGLRRPPCRCSSLVRPQRSPFLHPGPCAGSAVAHSPCQARADCAPARACA